MNRKHGHFYAPLGFAFFPLSSPALAPLALLQPGAFSPLLTLNYDRLILS